MASYPKQPTSSPTTAAPRGTGIRIFTYPRVIFIFPTIFLIVLGLFGVPDFAWFGWLDRLSGPGPFCLILAARPATSNPLGPARASVFR